MAKIFELEGTVNAPEFPQGLEWLNTDKPILIKELKGKVVLLDFWTYCCINCMHIIPDLKKLEAKYSKELIVIGVHSAKFENEKLSENIREAILRYEIEHPVVNDLNFQIWQSYTSKAWPTLVLIDPLGKVICISSGEGIYEKFYEVIANVIRHFDEKGLIDRRILELHLEKDKKTKSLLSYPGKIIADNKTSRLFITDSNHNRVLITSYEGKILDVIGDSQIGFKAGNFESARFFRPQGICYDPVNNFIYIADTENHTIRKIDWNKRAVETIAGTGKQARIFNREGKGKEIDLNSPWDLVLIKDLLYIAMAGSHQIWTLDLKTLDCKVFAGSGREDIIDGPLKHSALAQPSGITFGQNKLFFADSEVSAVRQVDISNEKVETILGYGLFVFGDEDGKYPVAKLQHPIGITYDNGFVYVADTYNHKIKRIDLGKKEVITLIGTGKRGNKDGNSALAELNEPCGLAVLEISGKKKIFIADTNNHVIRVYDMESSLVSTLEIKS